MNSRRRIAQLFGLTLLAATLPLDAQERPYTFGVISQRSSILTAQYWNPILRYLSQHSGVPLELKLAKTGPEHARMIQLGELDFIYSNHNFTKQNERAGYTVFARTMENDIQAQIVVLADSPITSLTQLKNKEVVFPSKVAFVGYYVPFDALIQANIDIKPLFAGTQEGAIGQLVSGRAAAAAVNSQIAKDFAARQRLDYRVLWSSEKYPNMPISAHPSVPKDVIRRLLNAMVDMGQDAEGAKILAASASLIKQKPPYGFQASSNGEFEAIRRFYQNSLVKEGTP